MQTETKRKLVLQREVVINYPVYMSSIDRLRCLFLACVEGFVSYDKCGLVDCVSDNKQFARRLVGILSDVPAAVKLVRRPRRRRLGEPAPLSGTKPLPFFSLMR